MLAWGASLNVYFKPSAPPAAPDHRWTVDPEHATKANAKVAVTYLAAKEGLVERMQFPKKSPPPGHVMWWDTEHTQNWKLKNQVGKKRTITEASAGESSNNSYLNKRRGTTSGGGGASISASTLQEKNVHHLHRPSAPPGYVGDTRFC